LISKKCCTEESQLDYAQKLLQHFVSTFKIIYGEHHISHNIHGLLHIVNDVKQFGCLDNFSCFPFENYMQNLKKLLKKDDKPLQQIGRRPQELENCGINLNNSDIEDDFIFLKDHISGPLIKGCTVPQYSLLKLNGMKFEAQNKANNCCCVKNGRIVIIENICYNKDIKDYVIVGKEFMNKKSLYSLPFSSSYLGIFEVLKLSHRNMWPVKSIMLKYYLFPIPENNSKFADFPLLHIEQEERPQLC